MPLLREKPPWWEQLPYYSATAPEADINKTRWMAFAITFGNIINRSG